MSTSHHRCARPAAVGGSRIVFALGCLFATRAIGHAQSAGETNAALKLTGGGAVSARALANQADNPTARRDR
jgi:hypothetical protein